MTKALIVAGMIAATIAGIGLMQLIGGTNPMNTNRPGWECDSAPAGKVCIKDAKPPK
jgi:hypothetical protein